MRRDPRARHEGGFQVEARDEHTRDQVVTCASPALKAVEKGALRLRANLPLSEGTHMNRQTNYQVSYD